MKHLTSIDDLTSEDIDQIFSITRECEKEPHKAGNKEYGNWDGGYFIARFHYQIATIFLEPSTRTRLSFEAAVAKLGGKVLSIPNKEVSSWTKGESIIDTIKTVSQYVDLLVLRTSNPHDARLAARISDIPVINAGDGDNEHPTQALLDLYTIQKEKGRINDLNVLFLGDTKHARTIRSLKGMLEKFAPDTKINQHYLCDTEPESVIRDKIYQADVVYMTRIQKERYNEDCQENWRGPIFQFSPKHMELMKKDAILMHPLPKGEEINILESDQRVAYWRQVKNGLYVRMALLKILLNHI